MQPVSASTLQALLPMLVSAARRSRSRASRVTSVRRTSTAALRLEAPVYCVGAADVLTARRVLPSSRQGAYLLWPMPAFFHALARSSLRPYNRGAVAGCDRNHIRQTISNLSDGMRNEACLARSRGPDEEVVSRPSTASLYAAALLRLTPNASFF